jgi:hypothetical protein
MLKVLSTHEEIIMNVLQNFQTAENNFAKKHWVVYLLLGFLGAGIAIGLANYLFFRIGGITLVKETALMAVLAGAAVITRTYLKIKE